MEFGYCLFVLAPVFLGRGGGSASVVAKVIVFTKGAGVYIMCVCVSQSVVSGCAILEIPRGFLFDLNCGDSVDMNQ